MSSHALANFEIQKHYQNEPWLSRVYLRNNLPKIKDDAYVINLDEYKSIKTHWRVCLWMVITGAYFEIQHTLIALELKIFQKKSKNS